MLIKKGERLPHLDANESVFFTRELEFVKSRSYDKKYADIKARRLIPMSTEADNWADAIVYESYDRVGMAQMINSYSDDLKRADIKGEEFITPVKSLATSFGYSIQEIRASAARGKNLQQRKANAAKRAILEKENNIAFLGDVKTKIKGFLNHSNVPDVTAPDDGTGSATEWLDTDGTALKSAEKILRDMHLLVNTVINQTMGVETPDTLLLPRSLYLYVASTPWSTSNDGRTILEIFLQQSQVINNVDWLNELETAGDGGSKRAMAYRRDPEAVTLEIPQDVEYFDPERRNLEYVVPVHSRVAGTIYYYPLSACYMDDI